MSVIEFFTTYWDWYLLFGVVMMYTAWATYDDDDDDAGQVFLVCLLRGVLWPPVLLSVFMRNEL